MKSTRILPSVLIIATMLQTSNVYALDQEASASVSSVDSTGIAQTLQTLKAEYMDAIVDSIIGVFEISRGTVAASLLSAREILIRMLIVGATHFLICHNHPSGHLQPSKYDVDSTKNIVNAGRTIGIPLVDHLIIGDGRYVSLLEEYGKELFG